jgi:hypothetical protein
MSLVGSVKTALSRPSRQPVSQTVSLLFPKGTVIQGDSD